MKKNGFARGTGFGIPAICLLMIFAGCSSPEGSAGPGTGIQIYDGAGNPITASGVVRFSDAAANVLDAGLVIDGMLALNLPASIADAGLVTMDSTVYDGPDFTPAGGKGLVNIDFHFYSMDNDSNYVDMGVIAFSSSTGDDVYSIVYQYYKQDITINGLHFDFDNNHTDDYRITAVEGWNKVLMHTGVADGGVTTMVLTTDLSTQPSTLQWVYTP